MKKLLALALPLALLAACDPTDLATSEDELVYGADDRLEPYQVTDAGLAQVVESTVAVVRNSDLSSSAGGYNLNVSESFGAAYNLCSDEPFRNQPSSAFCSGFLVGDDLIATAGHCITGKRDCRGTSFVFDFEMTSSSSVNSWFPSDDVYSCKNIVGRVQRGTEDWAVIQVDRPVVGRDPLAIRRSGTVPTGTELTVAGHPAGIPLKVAGGATVRANSASTHFEANLDTYGGNSGSAVFNTSTLEVEGILVRGNTDFVWTGSCYRSNVCADGGCPGWEDATRTTLWDHLVPVVEPPADCSTDGWCNPDCDAGADADCPLPPDPEVCDDGFDNDEDGAVDCDDIDCFDDPACAAPSSCGNGVCDEGESCDGRSGTTACASDCAGRVNGNPRNRFCFVGSSCEGPGCP